MRHFFFLFFFVTGSRYISPARQSPESRDYRVLGFAVPLGGMPLREVAVGVFQAPVPQLQRQIMITILIYDSSS